MALVNLIEELEAAKRSNAKLDEALAIVAGYKRTVDEHQRVKWTGPGETSPSSLPAFTKNIDSAVKFTKLLGPADVAGCSWEPGKAAARIGDGPLVTAANPAMALCVAALTQKLSGEPSE